MAGYSKDFLIAAYLHRFMGLPSTTVEVLEVLESNASRFYDEKGKDLFRVYAALDAEAIREYKNSC